MFRKAWGVTIVVTLVLVAGCATPSQPGGTVTSSKDTGTEVRSQNITQYENLSINSKSIFGNSINNRTKLPITAYPDDLNPDVEYSCVRYDGDIYRINWKDHGIQSRYFLHSIMEVENRYDAIGFENLSRKAKDMFTNKLENGAVDRLPKERFPSSLLNNTYIRYDNSTYKVRTMHGDVTVTSITAVKSSELDC